MTQDRALLDLAASRNLGVLATLRRNGRPQMSNVNHHFDADAMLVRVSVVDGRAKVSMLVASADGWSYAVLDGTADLSPVAGDPEDATVEELVEVYRLIRGEDHPDWDEYRDAMVNDRRLVLRLAVDHVYGMARQ
jgi:PPOX class probable F420-dependent enzyme